MSLLSIPRSPFTMSNYSNIPSTSTIQYPIDSSTDTFSDIKSTSNKSNNSLNKRKVDPTPTKSPRYSETYMTMDNNTKNDTKPSKKRFIWPDELHRDFIAAVFDYGLTHASSTDLYSLVPSLQNGALTSSKDVADATIRSHVQKLKLYRQHSKVFHTISSETDSHVSRELISIPLNSSDADARYNSSNSLSSDAASSKLEASVIEHQQRAIAAAAMRKKLDQLSETIQIQLKFVDRLKQSINTQISLQLTLQNKLAIIDPTYTMNLTGAPSDTTIPKPKTNDESGMLPRTMFEARDNDKDEEQIKKDFNGLVHHHHNLNKYMDDYAISSGTAIQSVDVDQTNAVTDFTTTYEDDELFAFLDDWDSSDAHLR